MSSACAIGVQSLESGTEIIPAAMMGSMGSVAGTTPIGAFRQPTHFEEWHATLANLLKSDAGCGRNIVSEDEGEAIANGAPSGQPDLVTDQGWQPAGFKTMPPVSGAPYDKLPLRLPPVPRMPAIEIQGENSSGAMHSSTKSATTGSRLFTEIQKHKLESGQQSASSSGTVTQPDRAASSPTDLVMPVARPAETASQGSRPVAHAAHKIGQAVNLAPQAESLQLDSPTSQRSYLHFPALTRTPGMRQSEILESPTPPRSQMDDESCVRDPMPSAGVQSPAFPIQTDGKERTAQWDQKQDVPPLPPSSVASGTASSPTFDNTANRQLNSPFPGNDEGRASQIPLETGKQIESARHVRSGITAETTLAEPNHSYPGSVSHDSANPHFAIASTFGYPDAPYGGEPAPSSLNRIAPTYETFSAIDASSVPDTAKWTLAGAHHAEAGFQDPSMGWVAVRAQETAGAIHATIIPVTAEAGQAISPHLAGLNAHMARQSPLLEPISLSAADAGAGQSLNDGQGRSSHQQHPHNQHPDENMTNSHFAAEPVVAQAANGQNPVRIAAITTPQHRVSILV